jgi:D-cysteine desulfhydrase family pyridoxal phosphate-dependent enzyme
MNDGWARLGALPRVRLAFLPTPLVELVRLRRLLGGPRLFLKRDDLTGLALGGNKTRKLEFLLGEALEQDCDGVITGGAAQSNHCRQTAAAAAAVGLACHLALGGEPPQVPNRNLLLDELLGAVVHWCGDARKGERIHEIAEGLRREGRRPYVIPYGGSNAVGAAGFAVAAGELKEQLEEKGLRAGHLIVASSSGGTQAGLTVGVDLFGWPARVVGIAIDKGEREGPSYESSLADLSNELAEKLGLPARYEASRFQVKDEYLGLGYGVVGDLEREAIRLVAEEEGILLDPVYTGRAMGGLIDLIRKGEFSSQETVVFWHTGGVPALFSYARELSRQEPARPDS